jgi:signal transduction histidine kinase
MTGLQRVWILLILAVLAASHGAAASLIPDGTNAAPHHITNVVDFSPLSGSDFIAGCSFRLTGTVTLVDTNRDLVVLQDASDAVALSFPTREWEMRPGQSVTISASRCCPLFSEFPRYPYHPSCWEISPLFETPTNWGEYNLTRMRGFLHPRTSGYHRFAISSDNSSMLYLSTDANPANARRITSIPRWGYTGVRQWTKYSAQVSDLIYLEAGGIYYIEALQEQTSNEENLAVAWMNTTSKESDFSVITGNFLTPWNEGYASLSVATNGILREYWTNYYAGVLEGMAGAHPYRSSLAARDVSVLFHGPGALPVPETISLSQPLPSRLNYRRVQAEGIIKFMAVDENGGYLEISDGQSLVPVHVRGRQSALLSASPHAAVRVDGVCEGLPDFNGTLMPGLIWAFTDDSIRFTEIATNTLASSATTTASVATNTIMRGYYGTAGIVTFNGRVFDKDCIFIQQDTAVMQVNTARRPFKNQFVVGHYVELGGSLNPDAEIPMISPLFVVDRGPNLMPQPMILSMSTLDRKSTAGRWCEIECMVHAAGSNGTFSVATKQGPACLWIGQTQAGDPLDFVDARLRVRGVLMPGLLDRPVLLVPSRGFISIDSSAPSQPFLIPKHPIASVTSDTPDSWRSHRVHVAGEVTQAGDQSFFIQDSSGGVQVQALRSPMIETGKTVEVAAFPVQMGNRIVLCDILAKPSRRADADPIKPVVLNLDDSTADRMSGTLVLVEATLMQQRTNGTEQVLQLQARQRLFTATLPAASGAIPDIAPGSRLRITGVCLLNETTGTGEVSPRTPLLMSLSILMRSPQDIHVLGGPPWWTWKRTAALVGVLLAVLAVALLWVHLLHRRLERQHAAQLAFSRHVLQKLEEERRRIAVNLHDSLGQTLLVIKNHAMLAIQRSPDGAALHQRLDEISGSTSQAIEEVRRITHGLRPYQLDRLGLSQAIRASVNRASENSPIVFASRVEDIDGLFDKDSEIHVYRIVQEAVTNVVKHSSATEATVVIKRRPESSSVSLSVRDNGRGFDPAQPSAQPHDLGYGLNGIADRVEILGGTLVIDSRPGEGTSLSVEIPIGKQKL